VTSASAGGVPGGYPASRATREDAGEVKQDLSGSPAGKSPQRTYA
jgi:hypothetical protein